MILFCQRRRKESILICLGPENHSVCHPPPRLLYRDSAFVSRVRRVESRLCCAEKDVRSASKDIRIGRSPFTVTGCCVLQTAGGRVQKRLLCFHLDGDTLTLGKSPCPLPKKHFGWLFHIRQEQCPARLRKASVGRYFSGAENRQADLRQKRLCFLCSVPQVNVVGTQPPEGSGDADAREKVCSRSADVCIGSLEDMFRRQNIRPPFRKCRRESCGHIGQRHDL